MQLYRLFATCPSPCEKRREYTALAQHRPAVGVAVCYSSFFISPANAANGLWVALAIFGLLVELSEKYC